MTVPYRKTILRALSGSAALAALALFGASCEKKMPKEECDNIRGEAFKLLNKAQPCNSDADCREASYPECRKPVNLKNFEALAEMKTKTDEGKCESKAAECKDSPPVYCKQGLCVNREPGREEP